MIFIYLGFFILIVTAGVTWYVCEDIITALITNLQANYATIITGDWITFIQAVFTWMLFLIMIGGIIWVYTQSQKELTPY